jgi:hypothetical protein
MAREKAETIEVTDGRDPKSKRRVDATKYAAMREAYLSVLPAAAPGSTAAEIMAGVLPLLPESLFPGGAKAGWWLACVQLDLEARGLVKRIVSKPLRFHRA